MDVQTSPSPAAPRCWCSRNWKWVVPLVLLLAVVVAGGIGWYQFAGKNRAFKSTEPYRMALKQVQQDAQVRGRLGEPVRDVTGVPTGTMHEEGDRGSADLNFRVAGPKGEGKVQMQARRVAGQWGIALLQVTFADNQRITLDADPQDDAPKFDPSGGGAAPKFSPSGGETPKSLPAPESPKSKPDSPGPNLRLELP
jgi:hypothetical protein